MCCRIFLTIFTILQFITVAAVVIGTPFDMFRPRSAEWDDNPTCLTLWGSKEKCYSTKYEVSTDEYWKECPERRTRFRAAEICAIITIAAFLISLILAFIQCCCCLCCKFLCLIFNLVGVATGIVVFALMLDSWNSRRGSELIPACAAIKNYEDLGLPSLNIGAGLALFIAAVGLGFINAFIALIPC